MIRLIQTLSISLVLVVVGALAPVAQAESIEREGYVKLPALASTTEPNGIYLMLDQGQVKTVDQATAKEVTPSKPKFRCILLPKTNGCL